MRPIPIVATGLVTISKRQRNVIGIHCAVIACAQPLSPLPVLVFKMRGSTSYKCYKFSVPVHIILVERTSGCIPCRDPMSTGVIYELSCSTDWDVRYHLFIQGIVGLEGCGSIVNGDEVSVRRDLFVRWTRLLFST